MKKSSQAHIQHCFNRAATHYDRVSPTQQTIGKKLITLLLNLTQQADTLMDLGCGTGLITSELLRKISYRECYGSDISEQMLFQAQQRLNLYSVRWQQADFDEIKNQSCLFDLVFSNMALHWSFHLAKTLEAITGRMKPKGMLAFSIPLAGTFVELNEARRNHFYSSTEIANLLHENQFNLVRTETESIQLEYGSLREALNAIKVTGASHVVNKSHHSLSGKRSLHHSQPFTLTYRVGYFLARKIADHA